MSHRLARFVFTVASIVAVVSMACASTSASSAAQTVAPAPVQAGPPPKLILFITVDQLRGDLLERYRRDLSKGYARLMGGGAWFTNGFQDHAITETAPGHASTMSGRFPASTGITSNSAGVVDSRFKLLAGARETGASPERFQGTTLTDWLTANNSRTHALSVSSKDRAAILPIGRSKQDVYWYSVNGSFTTSNYYRDTLPSWVTAFNNRRIPQTYAGALWSLSRPASTYTEPDDVVWEKGGSDNVFPHPFPVDTANAISSIRATPAMDSLTALFALEGLRQTGLGTGPQTDVMAVSFSATDYIGHAFGPDSREAHENEMRLDETIGWFLDSLYKLRDSSTVMIALTGDHGTSPIPELARERGQATGNEGLRPNLRPLIAATRLAIAKAGGDSTAFEYDVETVSIDRQSLRSNRISGDSLLDAFARQARQIPGIARVDRIATLRKANFDRDAIARRWAHQIPESSPVDLVMTLTRYSYWNNAVSTHGSPYDQDASVPIIFYGPWVKPGKYTEFARTVDMGVTLAAIAGVKPLERVDGVALKSALKP